MLLPLDECIRRVDQPDCRSSPPQDEYYEAKTE